MGQWKKGSFGKHEILECPIIGTAEGPEILPDWFYKTKGECPIYWTPDNAHYQVWSR